MIQQINQDNEAVTPVSREMKGLREFFPQCFNAQGEFDIDKFREAIEPQVDVTREGRSYDFLGKSYARMLSSLDTTTVIRPDLEHNSKPENLNSENIYISGDNLDALHHLVKSYAGQVKCIYIDPPYNTGTDGFVYNDKFKFSAEELEKKLSITADEAEKIIAMTSGHRASHAAWLTFMMPRLQLARDLLSKDGVIFISIDDNEQAYLKQLCDNVFGEDCFIAQFIWEKRKTRENRSTISIRHDYVLCYVANIDFIEDAFGLELMNDEAKGRYKNPDNDPKGPWTSVPAIAQAGHGTKNQFYSFIAPNGRTYNPPSGSCWRMTLDKMLKAIAENKIWFGSDGFGVPRIKKYLSEGKQGLTPESFISAEKGGTNDSAKREIVELFDGYAVFETPKPVALIRHLISLSADDVVVLDFFSGSATTAHAVMQMNADGGSRKFILIQLQEKISEDKEEIVEEVETEPLIEDEEPEIEEEQIEEPVVYEKRYLSFTTTNDEPLRFRKGPSEDAEIITKLFTGTLGYVTQPGNEWCKVVMTTGREGYLATEFLGMKELTEEEYPEKFRDLVEAPQEDLTELKFIEVSDEQTTDSGSEE